MNSGQKETNLKKKKKKQAEPTILSYASFSLCETFIALGSVFGKSEILNQ